MSAVKKNVFSAVWKLFMDGELRTEHGNRFHAVGPATTNARPVYSLIFDCPVRPEATKFGMVTHQWEGRD